MSNPFGDIKSEGLEAEEDRVGGFSVYETDAYDATVKLAYAGVAKSGAKFMAFEFDLGNGRIYKETVYATDRQGRNYYLDKNDDKKKLQLPGYITVNHICLLTTEKELDQQTFEEKVVKIYDFDQKKEIPTSVMVATDMLGKPITLGIVKQLENKSVKQGDKYVPIPDTRETNAIDKVFHGELKVTVVEARQGKKTREEAVFFDTWVERNKGKTRDKRVLKDGEAGAAGAPKAGGAAASDKPRSSLFG